ncbi:hypothetical protein [Stutzerimonas stutzeri]|uniref:hypothetical protein n=1 Tax=Stutzerimonas stutzeri TaxID=316 RepID=UPI0015E2D1EE|nr:hypothetical protein [Stutzerimonas stutzeri]MBA1280260.1 hypothetical protein [Stutzerimonas stutzeri]
MSHQVASFAHLKALLDNAPSTRLRAGQVSGNKPGILAGDTPVCRLREGPEGAAYASLIVETVNALPQLLKALDSASEPVVADEDSAACSDSPLRQQVEAKITQTLALLPGFKQAMTGTWAKLIYAAVEPWIAGGREVLSAAPQAVQVTRQQVQGNDHHEQVRLDAVTDFCKYMLAQEDSESRPNEFALEQWVNDWSKQSAAVEQSGTEA